MTEKAVARIRRKVLKLAKFRRLRSGVNQSGFTSNLAGGFKKRYIYCTFTDVPEIREEGDFLICNSGTMQPIRISVNTENEEDDPSICAKLQLSSLRLTPDLIDLLFWSIIAMCL